MQKPIFNNLRVARKNAGLNQIQVAKKLGLATTDRISRWEKGQGYPHLVNLFKLAAIYRVHPHDLYADFFAEVQWYYSRPASHAGISLQEY